MTGHSGERSIGALTVGSAAGVTEWEPHPLDTGGPQ
jgi:hypothetical protein